MRSADTRVNDETRRVVRRRSGGRCEIGWRGCEGTPYCYWRRQPGAQAPSGVLHACGACVAASRAHPGKALLMGVLVHEWLDPAEVMVKRGESAR